jgi:hypothetical protein
MEKEAIDLPQHWSFDHHVKLIPDAPLSIPCRLYPLSQKEEKFQNKFIDDQLEAGLIRKTSSPYATPVFYIKKKNGSYQPIFDYQKINAIMVKDVFPLPRIDTIIEGARGKILFSVYDLCNGYWCLQNTEESENILAFKTICSLYAPLVMPFSLTNTPACMQHFMNHIFAPLRNKYPTCFENYMDDCAIMTGEGELELHRQITREFFEILCENTLFLWPQKSIVEATEINFLRMRLNQDSITIDPRKLARLRDWPRTLGNVKEVRKVLSVLGY